jgi:hypothetical protein
MVTASTVELVTPRGAGGVILPNGSFDVPARYLTKPNPQEVPTLAIVRRHGRPPLRRTVDADAPANIRRQPRPGVSSRASRHGLTDQSTAQK